MNKRKSAVLSDLKNPHFNFGVYARTFQRNLSNFALAGPYAAIVLAF